MLKLAQAAQKGSTALVNAQAQRKLLSMEVYIYKPCRAPELDYENAHEKVTRLTNAFSKKLENHSNAIAVHFVYYNFVKIQKAIT